jgi:23S rRNA (adenine2030-N6)-methyltransferase
VNYRHAFHAGNFGDCVKHALLVWMLRAMQRKPAPVFVFDTHGGAGRYDLSTGPATRTGEWRAGIGRLLDHPPEVLADYVGLVWELGAAPSPQPAPAGGGGGSVDSLSPCGRAFGQGPEPGQGSQRLARYPGSPALIRALPRADDRLACSDLHPEDYATLRKLFARDPCVAAHHRDAWEALGALLPPPGGLRRALVLIDPPYEAPDEFDQVLAGLKRGHRRFPSAVFAVWYPIKHRSPVRTFRDGLAASGIRDVVAAELWLREPLEPSRLNGCGLAVINPPFGFVYAAREILSGLLIRLGTREPGEGWEVATLVDE